MIRILGSDRCHIRDVITTLADDIKQDHPLTAEMLTCLCDYWFYSALDYQALSQFEQLLASTIDDLRSDR